jgi:hypothetical protein
MPGKLRSAIELFRINISFAHSPVIDECCILHSQAK